MKHAVSFSLSSLSLFLYLARGFRAATRRTAIYATTATSKKQLGAYLKLSALKSGILELEDKLGSSVDLSLAGSAGLVASCKRTTGVTPISSLALDSLIWLSMHPRTGNVLRSHIRLHKSI